MSDKQIIYCQEPGDGSYSFHKVDIVERDEFGDRMSATIGPWERDNQWTDVAFQTPVTVKLEDDGDNVRIISGSDARDSLLLDYAQVQDLIMLLDAHRREQRYVTQFKRFQEMDDD